MMIKTLLQPISNIFNQLFPGLFVIDAKCTRKAVSNLIVVVGIGDTDNHLYDENHGRDGGQDGNHGQGNNQFHQCKTDQGHENLGNQRLIRVRPQPFYRQFRR